MGNIVPRLRPFLVELKRRKVYQIGVVYAAVAFVVWQAAEIAFPAVGLPPSAVTFVVVASLLGFPIALVMAWALEVTPEGGKVTRPANEDAESTDAATTATNTMVHDGASVADASAAKDALRPPTAETREVNEIVERRFLITEEICRKLDRETLDPRLIGDRLEYLDNQVDSDVLVVYLHGLGLAGYQFEEILEALPYRGVAPTMYGFEPTAQQRITLSLDDHTTLLREFVRGIMDRLGPGTTVLVGFSVGADLGFRVILTPEEEPPLPVHGYLSIGPNLSMDTCFASSLVARISADDPARLLDDLTSLGPGARSLNEWLNVHEYFVQVFRKFGDDIEALRTVAQAFVEPWGDNDSNPFVEWYRDASARLDALICVFSDTPEENAALEEIKLRNLDAGVLGGNYRSGSLVMEAGVDHFELLERDRHLGHLEDLLGQLR